MFWDSSNQESEKNCKIKTLRCTRKKLNVMSEDGMILHAHRWVRLAVKVAILPNQSIDLI